VLPTLFLLAVIAGAEVAVRATMPPLQGLDVLVAAPDQLLQLVGRQDTDARRDRPRIFEADPLLFWKLKPNVPPTVWNQTLVSTNDDGLRHPGPIAVKATGRKRIVCLGDSVTFGFRVPFATAEQPKPAREGQPYPRVLEERLRAAGQDVDVVAMAVPGYSSHQGLAWARRDLNRLDPDLVVIAFGWNDASAMPAADHEAMPMGAAHAKARAFLLRSQAALHIMKALRSHDPVKGLPPTLVARVPHERYVANVRGIVGEAARVGAGSLVLGPVYRDDKTVPDEAARVAANRRALAAAMRADGTPYIEVAVLTESGAPGNSELFVEHIHPNEAGHRHLAEALAEAIVSSRLLSPR
jgi:lysophospholipase L1-like esterase